MSSRPTAITPAPIFRDLAEDVIVDRPNRLWVADLTYVAIPGGFVYLAAILDAWSRKVVGYAISRSMDARIAVAALKEAVSSSAGASNRTSRLLRWFTDNRRHFR